MGAIPALGKWRRAVFEDELTLTRDEHIVWPRFLEHSCKAGRRNRVVLEDELDPFALRELNAPIPIPDQSTVPRVWHEPDSWVSCGERVRQFTRTVARAVVDHKELEVSKRLAEDAVETLPKVSFSVVRRDAH